MLRQSKQSAESGHGFQGADRVRQATATDRHELVAIAVAVVRDRQRCGMKFRRQHPLGSYTVDFYCAEAKLVVEVDGSPHQPSEGVQRGNTKR